MLPKNRFALVFLIFLLYSSSSLALPYFDIEIPSEGAGGGNLIARVYFPTPFPRYEEGAPVVVYVPGAFSRGDLSKSRTEVQKEGFVWITFLFPGGRDPASGLESDGIYDERGMNCIKALRDVLKFAAGRLPSSEGQFIQDILPFPVDTSIVGIYASSNGGVITMVTLDLFSSDLDFVDFVVGWENPASSQEVMPDLGQKDEDTLYDGDGNGFYDDDYKNLSYLAYGDTICLVDYSTIAYDPTYTHNPKFPKGAIFLDRYQPELDRYDYVTLPSGYEWPDVITDGFIDSTEDYLFGCHTYVHPGGDTVYFFSREVTHALAVYGVFPQGFPPWLATPGDADTFWYLRDATYHYDGIPQGVHYILLMSQNDHVQSARDKPHIHQAFDGFMRNNLWIRLNPDREYIVYLDSSYVDSLIPDNDAGFAPADWDSIVYYAYPEYLGNRKVACAAILEAADRTYRDNWDNNLDGILYRRLKAPLMYNVVLHYEEYNRYLFRPYLLETTHIIRRLADSLYAHGAKACFQMDWCIVEGIRRYDPGLLIELKSEGHEVTTHAHGTVYTGAEITRMINDLGVNNNKNGNGYFFSAHFDSYWKEIVGMDHVSLNKNLYTQETIHGRIHPFRPKTDGLTNRDWLTHDPSGKVVYTASNSVSGSFYSPNVVYATLVENFALCDTNYINGACSFIGALEPGQGVLVDSISSFLRRYADTLAKDSTLIWSTMDEIYEAYINWENLHPGETPYDDTLHEDPWDTVSYSYPQGWTVYTVKGDSLAGIDCLSSNIVTSIIAVPSGAMWVGTQGGINVFDNEEWSWIRMEEGLPGNVITSLCYDPERNLIWAGIDGRGLWGLKDDGSIAIHYDTTNGLSSNFVHAISVDSSGNLYVGTFCGGLNILDTLDTWHALDTSNSSLPDNDVFALEVSPDQRVYIGTSGGGLAYLENLDEIVPITYPDTTTRALFYIHSLKWHKGKLWAGTFGGGVISYDGDDLNVFSPFEGDNRGNEVHPQGLAFLGDTLLVSTYSADLIALREDGSWILPLVDIPASGDMLTEIPTAIFVDSLRNLLWIGTLRGLKVLDISEILVREKLGSQPEFWLSPSYPNPFTRKTLFQYVLPKKTFLELRVLDISGRVVKILERGEKGPGKYIVSWNGQDEKGRKVAGGVYFLKLSLRDLSSITRSTLLLR